MWTSDSCQKKKDYQWKKVSNFFFFFILWSNTFLLYIRHLQRILSFYFFPSAPSPLLFPLDARILPSFLSPFFFCKLRYNLMQGWVCASESIFIGIKGTERFLLYSRFVILSPALVEYCLILLKNHHSILSSQHMRYAANIQISS